MTTYDAPLETEQQARQLPAVQAVYDAFDADPVRGGMALHNEAMLLGAVAAAGVQAGAFDARIIRWLATWEPSACAAVAGLITRAAAGHAPITDAAADRARAYLAATASTSPDMPPHDLLSIAAEYRRHLVALLASQPRGAR